VERNVRGYSHRFVSGTRRRERLVRRLAPYLLGLPAIVWLAVFFLVPLGLMLVKALQECDPATGVCVMTWHWSSLSDAWTNSSIIIFRSVTYAAIATLIDLVLSFPIAYWIAFYAGRRKNFFLIMLLVPFFVSFVIRTVIWKFLLSSDGLVIHSLQALHLVSSDYQILGTTGAVIAGLAYNFLPFTALPLYVSLERLNPALLEASHDLYAGRTTTFRRVVLPLCAPGIFAAFLLTFIPAFGDYVNQQVLGGFGNTMVGTVIQNLFLVNNDFSAGSALSVIVMGISLIGIVIYGRLLGSQSIGDFV